jgi:hypothetical protein
MGRFFFPVHQISLVLSMDSCSEYSLCRKNLMINVSIIILVRFGDTDKKNENRRKKTSLTKILLFDFSSKKTLDINFVLWN